MCDQASVWSGPHTALQETKLTQLAAQRFGHILSAGRGAIQVTRRIFALQIAPALKRPERAWLDQDWLRLEHQVAATDSISIGERPHIEDALPAHDLAADHPIERSAVAQLVGALRHHSRPVHVLAGQAAFPALFDFLADPILQIPDRITADAKFDEMKGHGGKDCRSNADEIKGPLWETRNGAQPVAVSLSIR